MSLVDPHRNLLHEVVGTDHLCLAGLLVELGHTPPTPGVMAELIADVDHRARVHMAVVERVLLPALGEGDGRSIVDQVVANHDLVRHDLDRLVRPGADAVDAVWSLEHDLAEQVAYEDDVVLPAVEAAAGSDGTDGLAFAYSRLADAGVSLRADIPPG
jgi:hypothetical protein